MMIISLDIGGTNINAGLISNNRVLKKIDIKTGNNKKEIIRNILDVIYELMDKRVKAIAIGMPGPADYSKGMMKNSPNVPLNKINLRKIISSKFKKKIVFENDANCFVLGESIRLKKKNIIGLTLGTGVGGGIVIDGKLYRGKGNAGEIGHCTINYDSLTGFNQGDLEDYIGVKSIHKRYGKRAVELNEKEFEEIGKMLGVAISNIYHVFDPDLVVLGGGVSNAFPKFKSSMNKEMKNRKAKVKVIVGNSDSALIGASALVQ